MKSEERHPPKTVYGIICSIRRYLEEKNGADAFNPLQRQYRPKVGY